MYTANIVDTGLFRAIGKPPTESYETLRAVVTTAEATLHIPSVIYEELGGEPAAETPPSGSDYVDRAIDDGWVTVANPVSGTFADAFVDAGSPVERARHDAHQVIATLTNHPQTVNQWDDTAIAGLTVRLFEQNQQLRIIVHTTDKALATAVRAVVPQYGYYDIKTRYYPPRTAKDRFPVADNFTW
jgi:hypothetical protein